MKRVRITATDGMILTNGTTFGRMIWLGTGDSPDNWWEITIDAWQHIMEQEENRYEEDLY